MSIMYNYATWMLQDFLHEFFAGPKTASPDLVKMHAINAENVGACILQGVSVSRSMNCQLICTGHLSDTLYIQFLY
jgi:hypothetical protein